MSGNKVKGFLKGLRYISQIFESEKEQEIQIGLPTDVKHVAHIGWDGPSVNSPSWMNDFKTSPGFQSAPVSLAGDVQNIGQDGVKWASEDSRRKSSRNSQVVGRDLPDLPKSSRRQAMGGVSDSPTREKSEKPRQSRRSSKPKEDGSNPTRQPMLTDSFLEDGSPARSIPDIPKKSHRRKSKENSSSGSSAKSRSKAQSPEPNFDSESSPKSRIKSRPFDENEREIDRVY